ncbi:phosphodiester glycosidase family protein [Candidatus Poribacteria bacterium]|nr:phosphodiester glycosidase family protein [Candidatus Poribacteria bacterium]
MKLVIRLSVTIPLFCLIAISIQAGGKKTQLFPELSPGLNIYKYEWDVETCVMYVAEMSRDESTLQFEVALGNSQVLGKETVRSMAARCNQEGDRRVLIAVNGGFGVLGDMRGYGGVLENLHIQDGELITQPTDMDACFGVTNDGEFLSDPVQMNATIKVNNQELKIGCINQRRLDGCKVTLFTPRLGESTHTLRRRGKEIVLSGLQLPLSQYYESPYQINMVNNNGNAMIPRDGSVLWISSQIKHDAVQQFNPGATGTLKISLSPTQWNEVRYGIGGRLRLLKNGIVNQDLVDRHAKEKKHVPGKRDQFLNLSHEPRTALGYNDEKLFLIVADGRQPKYSTGLTLYELANILIELGATEAINLDGGSSSTFIVDGNVINKPSGKEEREVLNAVFITKDIQ